mmetsp:Transcript_17106/g.54389  ORF Transcript_17106/g.54389 Transcript_17106/m.54389 type:complete len:314 (-) Transcript_17106:328-1269(-)
MPRPAGQGRACLLPQTSSPKCARITTLFRWWILLSSEGSARSTVCGAFCTLTNMCWVGAYIVFRLQPKRELERPKMMFNTFVRSFLHSFGAKWRHSSTAVSELAPAVLVPVALAKAHALEVARVKKRGLRSLVCVAFDVVERLAVLCRAETAVGSEVLSSRECLAEDLVCRTRLNNHALMLQFGCSIPLAEDDHIVVHVHWRFGLHERRHPWAVREPKIDCRHEEESLVLVHVTEIESEPEHGSSRAKVAVDCSDGRQVEAENPRKQRLGRALQLVCAVGVGVKPAKVHSVAEELALAGHHDSRDGWALKRGV